MDEHDAKFEQLAQRTMEDIIKHGHQVRYIFPRAGEEGHTFSYTVGRSTKDKPELLLTGALAPEVAKRILNLACQLYDEKPFGPGDLVDEVLEGYPLKIIEVDDLDEAEMFAVTRHFMDATALQVLWPDAEGRYPGEPGFSYGDEAQPLFGRTSKEG